MDSVSILTPALNYGRFLRDALASVAGQGMVVQHVIQDGGSIDETLEILSASQVDWRSAPDAGQSDALNRAFARATGDWIGWLNADEFYLPGALTTLLGAARSSEADVVYGDLVLVDEAGRFVHLRAQHAYNAFAMRRFGPHIHSCAMLIRREVLGQRPWDPGLRVAMDWDLYLRLSEEGARFRYVPYPAGAFRLHGEQVTAGADSTRAESGRVASAHRIPRSWASVTAGLGMHRSMKVLNGSFLRQVRARSARGADLRWFREDVGEEPFGTLISRAYPARG